MTTHTNGIEYSIQYSRADRDYSITVDGQYIGSAANQHEAEEKALAYIYDLETSGALYTATQLDGGSSVEEIAADTQAAYDKLEGNDKDFADIVNGMLAQVEPPYRAMAEAGLTLLATACVGAGPTVADNATEAEEDEEIKARIYHAAFTQGHNAGHEQGFEEGWDACVTFLKGKIRERNAGQTMLKAA